MNARRPVPPHMVEAIGGVKQAEDTGGGAGRLSDPFPRRETAGTGMTPCILRKTGFPADHPIF